MKTKRLLFISCLAAGALIASPSFGKPAKKSAGMSQSRERVAPHTTQVMRHNQNISLARAAPATTAEPVTVAPALTRPGNTAGRVTTAHAITATITGRHRLLLWRRLPVYSYYSARRPTGVTAYPGYRTMGAVIRTVVTTTTTRLHANVRL